MNTLKDFARQLSVPQMTALADHADAINTYLAHAEDHWRDGITLRSYFESQLSDQCGVWSDDVSPFDATGVDASIGESLDIIDQQLAANFPDWSNGIALAAGKMDQ